MEKLLREFRASWHYLGRSSGVEILLNLFMAHAQWLYILWNENDMSITHEWVDSFCWNGSYVLIDCPWFPFFHRGPREKLVQLLSILAKDLLWNVLRFRDYAEVELSEWASWPTLRVVDYFDFPNQGTFGFTATFVLCDCRTAGCTLWTRITRIVLRITRIFLKET